MPTSVATLDAQWTALMQAIENARIDAARLHSSAPGSDLTSGTDLPLGGVSQMHGLVTQMHTEVATLTPQAVAAAAAAEIARQATLAARDQIVAGGYVQAESILEGFPYSVFADPGAAPALAPAFTAHADQSLGLDTNPGTRMAPDKTLAAARAIAAAATGQRAIGLRRGRTWREQLDISTLPGLHVASYGPLADALPLIDASDAVAAAEWTPTSGQAGVYEVTRTALEGTGGQHVTVWTEAGRAGVRAASLAACQSTPGSFFVVDTFTIGQTYRVYINPGSDPRTSGITYFLPARRWAINAAPGAIVQGVRTRRQLHHDGSLRVTGGAADVRDCVCEEGYIHDVLWEAGTVRRTVCRDTEFGFSFVLNHQSNIPVVGGVGGLYDSVAEVTKGTGQTGPGVFIHGNNSTRTDVHRTRIDGFESGIGCADLSGTMNFVDVAHRSGTAGPNKRTFDLQNQFNPQNASVVIVRPRSLASVALYLNTLQAGTRVLVWEPMFVVDVLAIQALQCTELHVVGGLLVSKFNTPVSVADGAGRTNLTLRHNVLQLGSDVFYVNLTGGSYTLESNVYHKPTGGDQRWSANGTQTIGSFSAWQGRGYDAGSVQANPLWAGANPNTVTTLAGIDSLLDAQGRLAVQAGSPLITVGAGPGRVPSGYTFPSWVTAEQRAFCGRP